MRNQFDYTIIEAINNAFKAVKASPLILGGVSGSGGGAGGPPGGFVGYLPQYRVSYDTDELAMSGFVQPGAFDEDGDIVSGSLLDNLNHIRWRISQLETGSGGGGGASNFLDLSDTPDSYATYSGYFVKVSDTEDGLTFVLESIVSDPAGNDREIQYNDAGVFGADSNFTWDKTNQVLSIGDTDAVFLDAQVSLRMLGSGASPSFFMTSIGDSLAPFITFQKFGGTADVFTALSGETPIGRLRGRGYTGSGASTTRVETRYVADGDWSPTSNPARIEFHVTPSGSTTLTKALTIESDGDLNIASGRFYLVEGAQHPHDEKENVANKVDTIIGYESDVNKYPTTNAVNDFALKKDSNAQVVIGEQVSISDDSVYSFTPPYSAGMILVQSRSAATTNYVLGFYVNSTGGSIQSYSVGSNTNLTTGTLTGTTGTDGKLTVSVNTTTGLIFIENRTGQQRNVVIKCW